MAHTAPRSIHIIRLLRQGVATPRKMSTSCLVDRIFAPRAFWGGWLIVVAGVVLTLIYGVRMFGSRYCPPGLQLASGLVRELGGHFEIGHCSAVFSVMFPLNALMKALA